MEQIPKKRDPFASALVLAFHGRGFNILSRMRIVWHELWKGNAVNGQKTPQPRILFPQPLVLPVGMLE